MNKDKIIEKLNEVLDLLESDHRKYHVVRDWFSRIIRIKEEIVIREHLLNKGYSKDD